MAPGQGTSGGLSLFFFPLKSQERASQERANDVDSPVARSRKLNRYRQKRDFNLTAEPSGDTAVAASGKLRFVIQKHAATRLHYDFRLELDGVFRSWAVTKGPSLNPADKRLAVEVEDHPLDYGDFEGTIPQGQYGGGTVQLWDRGYWEPLETEDPVAALRKGELKFRLHGARLHGSWVIVRMKHDRTGGKRNNWLLIKHRDEYAEENGDAILTEDKSVASARSMEEIAAGKGRRPKPFMLRGQPAAADAVWNSHAGNDAPGEDPKASRPARKHAGRSSGRQKREARRAPPPAFIEPQLCQPVDRPPEGKGWVHEIKFDGYRVQMRILKGAVTLKTRKGLDWTDKFGAIVKAASSLPDGIVDGEIVALDANAAPDFAALQAALSEQDTDRLIFFAFDLLHDGIEDLRPLPLAERKARLQAFLARGRRTKLIRYVEHFASSGDAVLKSACRLSLEGVVSKQLSAPYRSGRGNAWTKAKCRAGHEVVIGGWSTTNGKFRSLLAGIHHGDHFIYVGRVGTGYTAAKVKRLMQRLKEVKVDASPFTGVGAPRREAGIHWTKPELVAEIEFAGWTGDGMVRQAAFKGLREDKPAEEVQAETPARPTRTDTPSPSRPAAHATRAKAKTTAVAATRGRRPSAGSKPDVMGVLISKPDKPLWPDAGDDEPVTKLDLARYYEAVGPWMMPHLEGRPCSVVRAPDGYAGEQFFQRHAMPGTSSLLNLVTVFGDKKPYLQVDRVEGLAVLAQIAALELHPWNCQPGNPEIPGRLIFDLDPGPKVEFSAVIDAAKELRRRLAEIGLVGFCKTTGGKGLHVVTPLAKRRNSKLTWPQAKAFAKEICVQMARDAAERYVLNMAKKLRTNRIFLDYLRNDRMATAVAPLSPRARPGATVSMPLTWNQVKDGLDPKRYTVRTVPAMLSRMKAWSDYDDAERPLEDAIKKLASK